MKVISRRSVGALLATALGTFLVAVGLTQTPVAAQGAADQKMEQAFKNIKSLNGQSAELLLPTMVYFEAALGVGCPYCHDNDAAKRELDTKPTKQVARRMIEMVNAVNKNTFGGAPRVTCFTCHSGRPEPIGMPNVIGQALPPALGEDYYDNLPAAPAVPTGMSAGQLLDKYIAAVGGEAAVQKAPSLMAAGTVTQRRIGRPFPAQQVEISSKAPGMELIVTKAGQADNLVAYGPAALWAKAGNGAARNLRKAEGDATRLEDAFNLPAQIKQLLMEPKVERPEIVLGRELYVVSGRTPNLPRVKLYFEKESGMLRRLTYYTESSFGQYPTQIDYTDVRDVSGRKVPFTWVISQTRNREFTWAMQNVRAAAVEDAKFARPAAAAASQ
ncbi:MAG: photosynthetic reaction center cytochrome c subunit [Acidobacteria bacterium]|nr:photosynthetic reaction center cytochrome c subunit [Acidobacteriota bacterium]